MELTDACLDMIETHDAEVNAFLEVTADLARVQARAAEEEIRRIGPRSPMHGVPFALKDIYDTRGIATTGHSALYRQRIPTENSACTERLYGAGAVLLRVLLRGGLAGVVGLPGGRRAGPTVRSAWGLHRSSPNSAPRSPLNLHPPRRAAFRFRPGSRASSGVSLP